MIRCLFVLLASSGLVFLDVAWADVPEDQRDEVAHLLDFVENSDCRMVRNGTRHEGAEARKHIQRKYENFRKKIDSTESFIEYSASKSLISGKQYTVDCGEGEVMTTREWLLAELERYREL